MNPKVTKHLGASLAMAAIMGLAMAEPAFAAGGIEAVLQNVVNLLTGTAARLLAIIAIIIVGISWMFGFMDLRKAAYVVLGIAVAFGASEIADKLSG